MEIKRPWLERYDKGVPQHIDYPDVPLYYFVEEAARKYPDHVALVLKGGKVTYRQFNELSDQMAAALVAQRLAFLLLGGSMLAPKAGLDITPKLASWWLVVHVAFAKLTYGAFIAAMVLGSVYLFRSRMQGRVASWVAKLPANDVIDDLTFRFVASGFILLGIMIADGAI